mmetsp:Transcript_47796/g.63141  ORF Transcript_47796/g.63141 Transcript_47796/m.63141 type:complete len:470 (+) Transcript_47796:161-1570(+)
MSTDPFYRMFPAYLGTATEEDTASQYLQNVQGHCFMNMNISTGFSTNEAGALTVSVTYDMNESLGFCAEHLQASTAFSDSYNFYFYSGYKQFELTFTDEWEIADVKKNGIRFFTYCSDPFTFLQSTVTSALMWVGGNGASKYLPTFGDKPTNYQKEMNAKFLKQFTGIGLQERIINIVDIDQGLLKTGDILIGRRFTGDATQWMLLEGGYANHAAMIFAPADSKKKYVLDCPRDAGQFNPQPGAAMTELNEWLGRALAQDYEMVWLPLNEELRQKTELSEENLMSWFKSVEHSAFSSVLGFFAAVDTHDESFPAPLNAESVPINMRLFGEFEASSPEVGAENHLQMVVEGLRKRLDYVMDDEQRAKYTNPIDIPTISLFAADTLDMSLMELIAVPEREEWRYEANEGAPIFSAGSFVAGALKALGMFDGITVNTAEFTVKDIYELDIFNSDFPEKPALCIEADYSLDYC